MDLYDKPDETSQSNTLPRKVTRNLYELLPGTTPRKSSMDSCDKLDETSLSTRNPRKSTKSFYDFLKESYEPATPPRKSCLDFYDKLSETSGSNTPPSYTPSTEPPEYFTECAPPTQYQAFLSSKTPKETINTMASGSLRDYYSKILDPPSSPTFDPAFRTTLRRSADSQQSFNHSLPPVQQQGYDAYLRQNPCIEKVCDIPPESKPRLGTINYPPLYEKQSSISSCFPYDRGDPIDEFGCCFSYDSPSGCHPPPHDPKDDILRTALGYDEEIQQLKMRIFDLEWDLAKERKIKNELLNKLQRARGRTIPGMKAE
ncbi:uncharacterized protein KD926_000797 [Aspergillus affinis]|uniref:uncharacterized protein n=1 Tax=Aspergillus affinis TaxID=1070780 RepID=UPI0022FDCA45|nr:uncharacterized protein KD926_000797 [Aspergillus affinis]KAI9037149.1 hypothetical protein KD926_000797 [Aspergillus affinis]